MHRVKDLSPEQKLAIESLLGRAVSEDDAVSIRTLAAAAITPSQLTDAQRAAALERLNRYFACVDAQRQPVSHEEEEATLNEALRSTRPSYRPVG